jgi:hypothetical protein
MNMMALINRLFGRRHVVAPRAGQIWRSHNSGKAILVSEVETNDWGDVVVRVCHEREEWHDFNIVPMQYALGLNRWRLRILEEARFLEETLHSFPPHPLPSASAGGPT